MTRRCHLPLALLLACVALIGCDDTEADDPMPTADQDVADGLLPDAADADVSEDGPPPGGSNAFHYHRPDGDYAGWRLRLGEAEFEATSVDDFGAVYVVANVTGEQVVSFVNGDVTQPADGIPVTVGDADLWYFAGGEFVYDRPPPAIPGENQVVVHYLRDDGAYDEWGIHHWGDTAFETPWMAPARPAGIDERFGAWFVVDTVEDAARVNVIVHAGDTKDPGPDMGWDLAEMGDMVFLLTGSAEITPHPRVIPPLAISGAAAHWINGRTLAWNAPAAVESAELRADADGAIDSVGGMITGGEAFALTEIDGVPGALAERWPHLADFRAFTLPEDAPVDAMLRGQLVAVGHDAAGGAIEATNVQAAGALDALYAYDGPLGTVFEMGVPSLYLWAPTARAVRLIRFDADLNQLAEPIDLERGEQGVWGLNGEAEWALEFAQYEVEVYHPDSNRVETVRVTDPYAVSLSADSTHFQLADLDAIELKPQGWDDLQKPALAHATDASIYELHVRDFSAFDETVRPEHRGKFMAFVGGGAVETQGRQHLQALADAGLTVLHLLPSFDIATVREKAEDRVSLTDPVRRLCELGTGAPDDLCEANGESTIAELLATYDPASPDAQALHAYVRPYDAFNWGYDPFHYTVPEGSYATEPHGTARILEFRRMVQALSEMGLRIALDVVYNHTHASGLGEQSVLDKIVPGYYHRRNIESGAVENSTCCANTASEHVMMERLMVDSVVTWATAYKVDAFRFDLMGHHMKRNMLAVRDALHGLTPDEHGVDGPSIYLYGEGWNFGEVATNARGVNATQENMGGTGIGTFNDRIRDGVRGGGPFDSVADLRVNQGFANGLVTDANDPEAVGGMPRDADADLAALLETTDHIRLGMAGNLKAFKLINARGAVTSGRLLGYNGSPAGYADDPQDVVNYVSKHDNQTLFDNNAYKAPAGMPMSERLRMQIVALATVALGQGIPFFHAGSDILRSKSMERDSYDSGDWFNRLDWSMTTNNWNVGLPREDKDGANWDVIRAVIADDSLAATPDDIAATAALFRELLQIRSSSPLFRLRTGADVMSRVDFHNTGPDQLPGLIAMSITDGACAGDDLDPNVDAIVVLINAAPEAREFAVEGVAGFELHPIQAASADARTREAAFVDGTFTVPARTAAVFWQPQGDAQGEGLPCNTR